MRARHTSVVMFLIAGLFASPGWAGQSDGQKMEPLARQRSVLSTGWSRVIVRGTGSTPDADLQKAIARAGGRSGRALSIINARVAEVPNHALPALANSSTVARISLDRPLLGSLELYRCHRRCDRGATEPRPRRLRDRYCDHRLRHHAVARRSAGGGWSASPRVCRLCEWSNGPVRRLWTRHPRRRDRSREWVRFRGREKRHRAGCEPRRAESAGCVGRRHDQQRDCGARLCRCQQGRAAHPHRQPLRLGRRLRAVQHGSAHARGAAGGRRRSRRRRGGRQRRSRCCRGDAV